MEGKFLQFLKGYIKAEKDGKSLTWSEPLPTQIVQADPNSVDHFSSRQLHEGTINANLSWQFNLTALSLTSLSIFFNRTAVAAARPSGQLVQSGFGDQFGIDWIPNQNLVRLIIFNVTEDGTFTCQVATADVGLVLFQFSSIVQVDVVAPTSNIVISSDLNVTAPVELTLYCSADGKPKPTITWTILPDNTVVTMPLKITGENDTGSYRCTAGNGVGDTLTRDVFVDVHVPPMVTLASKVFVGREQTASLICEVKGNPTPMISWSSCHGQSVVCYEQYLNISKVQTARANYTCTATNALGVDSATTLLLIGGKNVFLRLNMTGECDNKDSVWETLQKELGKVFNNTQEYFGADLLYVRCGTLVFDVVLKFGFKVAEDDTISMIKSVIVDGKLGGVNVSSIIGIPPVERSTTSAPSSSTAKSDGTTSAPSTKEATSAESEGTTSSPFATEPTSAEREGLAGPPWAIIGGATGGVAVLAIVVGVLTWWVHKQKKCIKDSKIHNSDLERHDGEGGYSQVQGAYAQSGPPAANGTDSAAEQRKEAEAAIPTYAAVDKSKKSKKQADERPPEYAVVDKSQKKEKQGEAAIPTYAAVDKSSKKKKSHEEVPAVYAGVEKSKKKKKKKIDDKNLYENLDEPKKEKKPGELLYADLGDFQNPSMPTVSTSPQPLPAIKKADPYERTDYADITQFLKGNATLPPNDGNGDTEMKPKRPSEKQIQGNDKETPI